MKRKTIIAISWITSVLFALYLGLRIGTTTGISAGKSIYHAENVRLLQMDLLEAKQESTDETIIATIAAILERIYVIDQFDPSMAANHALRTRLKELQDNNRSGARFPDRPGEEATNDRTDADREEAQQANARVGTQK